MPSVGNILRCHASRQVLRSSGFAIAVVYVLWNTWWIGHGQAAPSLLTGLTGLPCPTTGGSRSFAALCRGDVLGSLYFNPMTLPILILLLVTLSALVLQILRRQRLNLSQNFFYAWAFVLMAAWIIKFFSPIATW